MAGPQAHAIQSAGGKAKAASSKAIIAKQLPGGPCPCTHHMHEGGMCGKRLGGHLRAGWCGGCAVHHRPELKAQAQGTALQRAITPGGGGGGGRG